MPASVIHDWLSTIRKQFVGRMVFDARKDPLVALQMSHRARKVHLIRAEAIHLRELASFPRLTELSLYESRAKSLAALRRCKKLRVLQIEDPVSLTGLERARNLTSLRLTHFTKITRLDPIGALRKLSQLSLATIASWDSSRRCLAVKSLAPLARLKSLRSLELMGVKPDDRRLDPLANLGGLKELKISHVPCFSMRDFVRLANALPCTRGSCLEPHWIHPPLANILRCQKCRTSKVFLTAPGPRKRQMLCPYCDKVALRKHNDAWAALLELQRRPKP